MGKYVQDLLVRTPLTLLRRLFASRRFQISFGIVFLVSTSTWGWMEWRRRGSIDELPDVGEPFDVQAFMSSCNVPKPENAFELYRQAFALLDEEAVVYGRDPFRASRLHWRDAEKPIRQMHLRNKAALDLWFEGSGRPRSVCFAPGKVGVERDEQFAETAFGMRSLAALAQLEATRMESMGRFDQALHWHKALLRSSRHLGMLGAPLSGSLAANCI